MERFEVIKRRYARYLRELEDMYKWGHTASKWHKRYLYDVGSLLQYYEDLDTMFQQRCEPKTPLI